MLKWSEQALAIYERLDDLRRDRPFGLLPRRRSPRHRRVRAIRRAVQALHRDAARARSRQRRRPVHSLGDLYLDKGDLPSAERYYHEALAAAPRRGRRAAAGLLPGRSRLRGGPERRRDARPDGCGRSPSGSSSRSASGCCTPSVSATSGPYPSLRDEATSTAPASRTLPNSTHSPRSPNSSALLK